jgi:hypothetical protein
VIVTDMVVVRGGLVGGTAIELRVASSATALSFVRDHIILGSRPTMPSLDRA